MQNVLCDNCLRTYKPYTYRETLYRAIVSGVDEWQGVDDEHHIVTRYDINRHNREDIHTTIRHLFPNVEDFNIYHRNFNIERRKKISAISLCFDCEKYVCAKCTTGHTKHFAFFEDDKNNKNGWNKIVTEIMRRFNAEGDAKEEYIKQERAVLCNVVDVRDSISEWEWEIFLTNEINDVYELGRELDSVVRNICTLNDNQTLLVINVNNKRMKIYSTINYKLIGSIELPYTPAGITEIPSTDPSQSFIAVSFPFQRQIDIMDIQRRQADVIYSFKVQGKCRDLAYCNNKLITLSRDFQDRERRESIHVMDMAGEIINIIDLHKFLGPYAGSNMSAHSERETIYVCHFYRSVTCLSLTGQVLHYTRFTDLIPRHICVDRDQNVYVMDYSLPLYKLSSNLKKKLEIIDKDAARVGEVTAIIHKENKNCMADLEGFVYILSVD